MLYMITKWPVLAVATDVLALLGLMAIVSDFFHLGLFY